MLTEIETTDLSEFPSTSSLEAEVAGEQAGYLNTYGCYVRMSASIVGDVAREVHEYKCPNKEAGWQCLVKATVNGKDYLKSFGLGDESASRSFDWTEAKEDEA